MIESNNEQIFICVGFYTADEKLHVNMKIFWVRNLKTGTNRFNPGHQDSIPKTGNVPAKDS